MDQFDLFDLETTHTENTRTTEVVTPPVQTTYDDDSLWAYAIRNQQLIWSSETHRKRSLEQLDKFIKLDPAFQSMSLVDFGTDHFDAFANHLIAIKVNHTQQSIGTAPRLVGCLTTHTKSASIHIPLSSSFSPRRTVTVSVCIQTKKWITSKIGFLLKVRSGFGKCVLLRPKLVFVGWRLCLCVAQSTVSCHA